MDQDSVGTLVVQDEDQALLGILSDRDEDALALMASAGVRRLPVVDLDDDRVIGILSVDDVLGLLSEEIATIGQLLARYESDIPTS